MTDELNDLKKSDLKSIARDMKIKVSGTKADLVTRVKSAFATSGGSDQGYVTVGSVDRYNSLQGYHKSQLIKYYAGWVYAGISLISEFAATVPLRLYIDPGPQDRLQLFKTKKPSYKSLKQLKGQSSKKLSKTIQRKAVEFDRLEEVVDVNHPVLKLISRFNPAETGIQSFTEWLTYLIAFGDGVVKVEKDTRGIPQELYVLATDHLTTDDLWTDGNVVPARYWYQSARQRVPYDPEDIIHAKLASGLGAASVWGMGRAEACWRELDLINEKGDSDVAFFRNGAVPLTYGVLKTNSEEQLKKFSNHVINTLRGSKNHNKFLAIGGDQVELKALSVPPKELGDPDKLVGKIAAVLHIPLPLLKADEVNRANAIQASYNFVKHAVEPILTIIEDALNNQLLPMFNVDGNSEDGGNSGDSGGAFLLFDDITPVDKQLEINNLRTLVSSGIISQNEARAELGRDRLDNEEYDELKPQIPTVENGATSDEPNRGPRTQPDDNVLMEELKR